MLFDRDIVKTILEGFDSRDIIFLLGTRQTGKTTIAGLIAEQSGYPKNNIIFIDFEDKRYRQLFNDTNISTLQRILELEGMNLADKSLLIFDEIQLLTDPANLLKLLHDHYPLIKIVATGSSSLDIRQKFSDSLAGRKRVYQVEPLNFSEFLNFKGEDRLLKLRKMFSAESNKDSLKRVIAPYAIDFLSCFEEYLIFGSYPEVVLIKEKKEKVEKLDSIATSYIQKDIRDIARIDNIDGYNNLLKYLAVNACSEMNISTVANTINFSRQTLSKYLTLLEQTFIVKELKPFYVNKTKEIAKMSKIFYKDTGIRNLQIKNFNGLDMRTDSGELYETYLFNHLDNSRDILTNIYFYRTQLQTEIDFISERSGEYTLMEVKAGDFRKIPRALMEFEKKYYGKLRVSGKSVINRSYLDFSRDVKFLPLFLI